MSKYHPLSGVCQAWHIPITSQMVHSPVSHFTVQRLFNQIDAIRFQSIIQFAFEKTSAIYSSAVAC